MKKILYFLLVVCSMVKAQIGINTNTPAGGTILHVESNDKGILIPRVNINDLSTIDPITGGSPTSLIVYNTNTSTQEGFYFWNGVLWTRLLDSTIFKNIYTINGVLPENRFINQGNFKLDFDNSTLVVDGNKNRVGLGTNLAESNLHIKSPNNDGDVIVIIESNTDDNEQADTSNIIFKQDGKRINTEIGLSQKDQSDFLNVLPNSFCINTYGVGIINSNIQFATGGNQFTPQSSTQRMTILRSNGRIGIGLNNPSQMLTVIGETGNTSGVWNMNSDSRIKHVGEDFTDGLNVIKKIRPVHFNYTDAAPLFDGGKNHIGIIAQELESIAPYMVSKNEGAGYSDLRTLNPQAFPYLLINALQEQQLEGKKQKEEIAILKAQITQLMVKTENSN